MYSRRPLQTCRCGCGCGYGYGYGYGYAPTVAGLLFSARTAASASTGAWNP